MPATTRVSSNLENKSDTTTPKTKMSEKKLTLDDILGEIKKGNTKTDASIAGLEKQIEKNPPNSVE